MKLSKMLATNVKIERKRQGISQEVLAEKLGVSASYISKIERGLITPSLKTLDKLAKKLNVPPYMLLMKEEMQDKTTKQINEKLKKLPLKKKKFVNKFLDSMIDELS